MTVETFFDALCRFLMEAQAEREAAEDEMARKAKEPPKWNPETLRALAYRVYTGWAVKPEEIHEAIALAADEIERLEEAVKWAYVRSAMRREKKGRVEI